MRVQIIQFSPSGNTRKITNWLIEEMIKKEIEVCLADMTGNTDLFRKKSTLSFFMKNIRPHDILMIGGPVYAHHLQYHLLDLIDCLPIPDKEIWGKIAIPYITYGGIHSGIALEEAGKKLKKSGREVFGGLKFNASHKMTRAFMDKEFNEDKPDLVDKKMITDFVDKLIISQKDSLFQDRADKLIYQSRIEALKIKLIFNEKKWHEKRYPKIKIVSEKCVLCGKCVGICPVLAMDMKDKKVNHSNEACIHCLNCVVTCPEKAIVLEGNIERGKKFMTAMIEKKGNQEKPSSCFY